SPRLALLRRAGDDEPADATPQREGRSLWLLPARLRSVCVARRGSLWRADKFVTETEPGRKSRSSIRGGSIQADGLADADRRRALHALSRRPRRGRDQPARGREHSPPASELGAAR